MTVLLVTLSNSVDYMAKHWPIQSKPLPPEQQATVDRVLGVLRALSTSNSNANLDSLNPSEAGYLGTVYTINNVFFMSSEFLRQCEKIGLSGVQYVHSYGKNGEIRVTIPVAKHNKPIRRISLTCGRKIDWILVLRHFSIYLITLLLLGPFLFYAWQPNHTTNQQRASTKKTGLYLGRREEGGIPEDEIIRDECNPWEMYRRGYGTMNIMVRNVYCSASTVLHACVDFLTWNKEM